MRSRSGLRRWSGPIGGVTALALALVALFASQLLAGNEAAPTALEPTSRAVGQPEALSGSALSALAELAVKGRAPKTGYSRDEFSSGWGSIDGCDLRNLMLARDLVELSFRDGCIVESGVLLDPYTAERIEFVRGVETSLAVQIDHVVAVSDAWQKGAQRLSTEQRYEFYNDPLNLIAVSGPANQQKSDSDAASWLPANRAFRCEYVAIQIAVKQRYQLWVTPAERDAMQRVLSGCPDQAIPVR